MQQQAGYLRQTQVCFSRCVRTFMNDRGWKCFISVALIMVIIGLVVGDAMFVEYGATKNGAFALVCAGIWIGIFNSIRSICRERDIVRQEHRTGLNVWSYVTAHWLFEACLCAAECVIVTLLVAVMSGDHFVEEGVIGPAILDMYISFFCITFSSDSLGLLISSIVRTENSAMTIMPFALIVQLVMSGTIFSLEGVTDAISNLTISRWGLDAICSVAHVNKMAEVVLGYVEPLAEQDSTAGNLVHLWFLLVTFAVAYGVLSAVALLFVDER